MVRVIEGAQVCGFRRTSFTGQNGETVHGYNVYFQYPLSGENSEGNGTGSFYLSSRAFDNVGITAGLAVAVIRNGTKFDLVTS